MTYQPAFLSENPETAPDGLNPNLTFDTFFPGGNEVVSQAAHQVCSLPGQVYNPLLIVGNNGLGKTHLLNALGLAARGLNPQLKVRYTTSEGFVRDLIHGIREQRMEDFRAFYRSMDLWLVDDIDFLAGKDTSSEEFLHTFNELVHNGRQIVVASRHFPQELPALTESLRSRLLSGVVTRLEVPGMGVRVSFLENRNRQKPVQFSPEVLALVAETVPASFGELEGALNSLVVFSQSVGKALNKETAAEVLANLRFRAGVNSAK